MSILDKVRKELKGGLDFMEGKEKGNINDLNKYESVNIIDFGFLIDRDSKEEYACFVVYEEGKYFYFGGSVVTEKLRRIQEALTSEELTELLMEGLPVKFVNKKSEKGRKYIDMVVQ